jgi:ribosomal protein S18 acetylase RimI-like enzyme
VRFRRAGASDIETIRGLWDEYAAEIRPLRAAPWPWSWADVAPLLAAGGAAFLAENEGEAVAFLIASRSRHDIGHVDDLYVRRAHRGKGVAKALLRHVAVAFRERGVTFIALDVDRANEAARSLYEGLGFVPYAERFALGVGELERRLSRSA